MGQLPTSTAVQWHAKRGVIAVAICVLLLAAIVVGGSRQCMSDFELGIIEFQLIMGAVFGAPLIALTVAAAFITAAVPSALNNWSRLTVAAALLGLIALSLATPWPQLVVLTAGGMLVGLILRSTERYRKLWSPVGVALAIVTAVTLFATGHYGMDNCYP